MKKNNLMSLLMICYESLYRTLDIPLIESKYRNDVLTLKYYGSVPSAVIK